MDKRLIAGVGAFAVVYLLTRPARAAEAPPRVSTPRNWEPPASAPQTPTPAPRPSGAAAVRQEQQALNQWREALLRIRSGWPSGFGPPPERPWPAVPSRRNPDPVLEAQLVGFRGCRASAGQALVEDGIEGACTRWATALVNRTHSRLADIGLHLPAGTVDFARYMNQNSGVGIKAGQAYIMACKDYGVT